MSTAPPIPPAPAPDVLQILVDAIAKKAGAGAALFETDIFAEGSFSLLYATADFPRAATALAQRLKDIPFTLNQPVPINELTGIPSLKSGLIIPLSAESTLRGALVVANQWGGINDSAFYAEATSDLALLSMALENRFLHQLRNFKNGVAQTVLKIAGSKEALPTAQEVVEVLRNSFSPQISGCAILRYGPLDEARPDAPREYLEIRGAWTQKRGSGGDIGIRLGIESYHKRLELLEKRKYYVFQEINEQVLQIFDPLVRGLLRDAYVRSMVIIPLQAAGKSLGLLILAADHPYHFNTFEVFSYRMIGEYLALTALATRMMRQRDSMQLVRRAMLSAVSDGILLMQPGAQGGQVISSSIAFNHLFGLSEVDIRGKSLYEVLSLMALPEDVRASLTQQWIYMPVRSSDVRQGEFRAVNSGGQPLEILWTSTPVYQSDQVRSRVYAFHDVTADRASARIRAEFLSRISHELRTPLTSIQGFAEFILEVGGHDLAPRVREYTQIILSSAKHLKAIISDIIDLTRLDAGQIQLAREANSLPNTIREVVISMEPLYRMRGQRVTLMLQDQLPLVNIDRTRIKQVLSNLISNAVKYAPENSEIQIQAQYVAQMDDLPEGFPSNIMLPAILITVADEGGGITAEDAGHVFMPFFRTEQARRERAEGVGLGLTVVRSLIEAHQGSVWLIPCPPAAGGYFIFTLPVARDLEAL